jgi:hypothetical protein
MDEVDAPVTSSSSEHWTCCKKYDIPREQIIYFAQIILIYIVVLTSLSALLYGAPHVTIWLSLLSACIGYMLPAPSLKTDSHHHQDVALLSHTAIE